MKTWLTGKSVKIALLILIAGLAAGGAALAWNSLQQVKLAERNGDALDPVTSESPVQAAVTGTGEEPKQALKRKIYPAGEWKCKDKAFPSQL